jgi:hypothetical protein
MTRIPRLGAREAVAAESVMPLQRSVRARGGSRTQKSAQRSTTTFQDAFRAIQRAETEAQFQRRVRAVLSDLGFIVWVFPIMKRTIAGVPDLTFFHLQRPGRMWFWELKREKGRVRPEQALAIAHLSTVPGVDARIVRPSDWEALRDSLSHAAADVEV